MKILESLHNYDLLTFDWCLRRRHFTQMTVAARWVSRTADGHLYGLLALALLISQDYLLLKLLLIGLTIERVAYFILKNRCRRNRPPQAIPGFQSVVQPSDQFSFPSGHTSAAFFFSTFLSTFFPIAAWFLYPWAVTVGMSRVILGVHFPTDILAGALLGHSIAFVVLTASGIL